MKVLIINAYSAKNIGDAGIVVAMILFVKKKYPKAEISVMSSFWRENIEFYKKYNVKSVPSVWLLKPGQGVVKRYLGGIICLVKSLLNKNSTELDEYRGSSLILSAGGGYIYSSKRGGLGIGLLNSLFHYWLGPYMGKVTIGFPQSLGPFNNDIDGYITGKILAKCNLIFSREAKSTNFLMGCGVNHIECPDIAFTLPCESQTTTLTVGVTVLDWSFAKQNVYFADLNVYLDKLNVILCALLEKFPNLIIKIFPQVNVSENDSDFFISKKLESIVDNERCAVSCLPSDCRPEELIKIYSSCSLFIGSRMHSAIFSLVSSVPTIALAYQPKTVGTFELVGLGEYVHDIALFDSDCVLSQAVKLISGELIQVTVKGERVYEIISDAIDFAGG